MKNIKSLFLSLISGEKHKSKIFVTKETEKSLVVFLFYDRKRSLKDTQIRQITHKMSARFKSHLL